MASPWRILDRLMLASTWPALVATIAVGALGWLAGGPKLGLTAGPFGIAVGLAVAYGNMARDGEYAALLQAGIAPRRIGAVVVACALALALVEALVACAFYPPAARTEYAGYIFMALQLPLMASLALPVAVSARNDEPWARVVVLLIAYTLVTTMLRVAGPVAGWAPGAEWFFSDAALVAADFVLYRTAAKPGVRL